MKQAGDHRDFKIQGGFSNSTTEEYSISNYTESTKDKVRHAAMTTTPRTRPRPGRRRLTMSNLPLGLTQVFFLMTMILSVLYLPAEAAEHPGSHSPAKKSHFVDGRIIFDHELAPHLELHRRDDSTSTSTASTTAIDQAAVTSSSAASTTTTSLPRAFDGGFGTNFTQPSCPTFLRAMVNNDTFTSCVPFSLLLQVRRLPPPAKQPLPPLPLKQTNPSLPRIPCPSSTPPAPSAP